MTMIDLVHSLAVRDRLEVPEGTRSIPLAVFATSAAVDTQPSHLANGVCDVSLAALFSRRRQREIINEIRAHARSTGVFRRENR